MQKENVYELIDVVLSCIDKLPNPPREFVKREFQEIKELLVDSRPPKIMIIGRRGAGKSSLINAIFGKTVAAVGSVMSETGEPVWHKYEEDGRILRILDTRGLGDRSKPESANFENAFQEIQETVRLEPPDVILFLCKAKEVDSRISEDLKNVVSIRDHVNRIHKCRIPIASAVTQVDELDPKRVEPPYEHEIKQDNIRSAVSAIETAFSASSIDVLRVVPISAYAEYENGRLVYSNYWNIDTLVEYLIDMLPNEAQVEMARLARFVRIQKRVARRKLVAPTAATCAGIAAFPIPLADVIPITTAQIMMIIAIGHIAGKPLSKETARHFLAALGVNLGAGFALREGARALIKFVFPGGGLVVSAGVAAAGTWAIGEAAIAFFVENKPIEEAKKVGQVARKRHLEDSGG